MDLLKKTYLLILPLLLTSCWEDFDPRIDTKPVLCLNSLITAGQPIEVKVTHTWVFTDEEGAKDHSVKDAVVEIYANGDPVDASYLPVEGDRIRIHASSLKYGEAEAEVTVPVATQVSDVRFTPTVTKFSSYHSDDNLKINADMWFDIRISMDIDDPKDTDNFHCLSYLTFNPHGVWADGDQVSRSAFDVELWGGNFDALDPVFYEQVDTFEDILEGTYYSLVFSDRMFSGEAKTLDFGFSDCRFLLADWDGDPDDLDCGWIVTIFSISESYYNWLIYVDRAYEVIFNDLVDIGLSEPIWGYSNVSTGAGVVAAQSSASVTIDLRPFLEEIMESGHPDR